MEMNLNVPLLHEWRDQCRSGLIKMEEQSIIIRINEFEKIINEKTSEINRILCVQSPSDIHSFKFDVNLGQITKFIEDWRGLSLSQLRSVPNCFEAYENRAKNWLNGRRSTNYAQHLFPAMFESAANYSKTMALIIYPTEHTQSKLYSELLTFGYIAAMSTARVVIDDAKQRSTLICENSIRKSKKLKAVLQQYFIGNAEERQVFPMNLEEMTTYFTRTYYEKLNAFRCEYTDLKQQHGSTSNNSSAVPPIVHQNPLQLGTGPTVAPPTIVGNVNTNPCNKYMGSRGNGICVQQTQQTVRYNPILRPNVNLNHVPQRSFGSQSPQLALQLLHRKLNALYNESHCLDTEFMRLQRRRELNRQSISSLQKQISSLQVQQPTDGQGMCCFYASDANENVTVVEGGNVFDDCSTVFNSNRNDRRYTNSIFSGNSSNDTVNILNAVPSSSQSVYTFGLDTLTEM